MPQSNLYEHVTRILTNNRGFPHQSSGDFRPSEGSATIQTEYGPRNIGSCSRAIWYRLKGIPKTDGDMLPHQVMRMEVGNRVEDQLASLCKDAGIFLGRNIKFSTKLRGVPYSGELDLVIKPSIDSNDQVIVECKSIYSYYPQKEIFGKFLRLGRDDGKPKDSYLMQLGIYLYEFSLRDEDDPSYVPFGAIYVADRGDGHYGVFDVWLEKEEVYLNEDECRTEHRLHYGSQHMKIPTTRVPYTMENVIDRNREILLMLDGDVPPERDYQLEWDRDTIEQRHAQGEISDSKYKKWMSSHSPRGAGKEKIGDWQCSYCNWKTLCQETT